MDLYLIHQPYGEYVNVTPKIWNHWIPQFDSVPSVNQVEYNPYFQQKELRSLLTENDVKVEAWRPLAQGNADLLKEPAILAVAEKYSKNAGQVILRFENQEDIIVFPKSTKPERIRSNMEIQE